MDLSEREETTKYASKKIKSYLDGEDYTSALLLSSIYVNMRLRSLLADRLFPPRNKWKAVSNKLDVGFNRLLNLCQELGLLHGFNKKPLKNLWEKRCNVAHESKLWKELSQKDKEDIRQLCESAIKFLEKTQKN